MLVWIRRPLCIYIVGIWSVSFAGIPKNMEHLQTEVANHSPTRLLAYLVYSWLRLIAVLLSFAFSCFREQSNSKQENQSEIKHQWREKLSMLLKSSGSFACGFNLYLFWRTDNKEKVRSNKVDFWIFMNFHMAGLFQHKVNIFTLPNKAFYFR